MCMWVKCRERGRKGEGGKECGKKEEEEEVGRGRRMKS